MIKRALISVSDKTGLLELGKALKGFQVEILSTGGTAKTLNDATIPTISVSDYTGFPEMMNGRLKTLHPKIYGALLGRRDDPSDQNEAKTYGIQWIDLVVVNLYPFQSVASASKKPSWNELVENIDIGGVSMIRAAAKNHASVMIVVDPKDYGFIIQRLKENSTEPFDAQTRYQFACKAFQHTAIYDSAIAETLSHYKPEGEELTRKNFPTYHSFHGKLSQELRYGENPHQNASLYRLQYPQENYPLSQSLQGKELSFNNILDAGFAWRLITELPPKSCVIIKHNNPCGVGLGSSELESFQRAYEGDPESAFGGIVAISGEVDGELASKMKAIFLEVICAESFTLEARELLQEKKNLRLMLIPKASEASHLYAESWDIKKVPGGYLIQDRDQFKTFNDGILGPDAQIATELKPTEAETRALRLAWVVAKNCKSNAIVITNEHQTLGIGCGHVNRRFASEAASSRAKKMISQIKVCASDGFFPFADSLGLLKEAGVTAIVQPGGSIKDRDVIESCNKEGLAMILTGTRHFSH